MTEQWTGDDSESFEEYTKLHSIYGYDTEEKIEAMVDDRLSQIFGTVNDRLQRGGDIREHRG